MSTRVLVTGASGFVGRAICEQLAQIEGYEVRAAARSAHVALPQNVERVLSADLAADANWSQATHAIDVVIHAAARVHVMRDRSADPLAAFRSANVAGTLALARQAVHSGVRRFIFISSIKVNGEFTEAGRPFSSADSPQPQDPYGLSKLEAEQGLKEISAASGMEAVVIRPPLVYGPGVKANFRSMMGWILRGIPLPFAGVTENRRSLVALDNLVDLIEVCVNHPAASNRTLLVSDGEDISTAKLLVRMGDALARPAKLFQIPPSLLTFAASIVGKSDMADRLTGSLQVDISETRRLLDWAPPISMEEGLRRVAGDFLREATV